MNKYEYTKIASFCDELVVLGALSEHEKVAILSAATKSFGFTLGKANNLVNPLTKATNPFSRGIQQAAWGKGGPFSAQANSVRNSLASTQNKLMHAAPEGGFLDRMSKYTMDAAF